MQASISGGNSAAEKINTLLYVQYLATDALMASLLINSGLACAITKLAGSTTSAPLKAHTVSALAFLLRHTTHLNQAFAQSELCAVLTAAARHKSERVRTRAVAALGELLFYFAIRNRQQHQPPAKGAPTTGARVGQRVRSLEASWVAPPSSVAALIRALGPEERPIAQH